MCHNVMFMDEHTYGTEHNRTYMPYVYVCNYCRAFTAKEPLQTLFSQSCGIYLLTLHAVAITQDIDWKDNV